MSRRPLLSDCGQPDSRPLSSCLMRHAALPFLCPGFLTSKTWGYQLAKGKGTGVLLMQFAVRL